MTTAEIQITATDKRESILKNFNLRLSVEQKRNVQLAFADLEIADIKFNKRKLFDGILADVPCSGSGTWGRTPEMLNNFNLELLLEYTNRQKTILSNILPYLKPGGKLIYITCSVFRVENEEMATYISGLNGMKQLESAFVNGLPYNSDSMFYAIFERNGSLK